MNKPVKTVLQAGDVVPVELVNQPRLFHNAAADHLMKDHNTYAPLTVHDHPRWAVAVASLRVEIFDGMNDTHVQLEWAEGFETNPHPKWGSLRETRHNNEDVTRQNLNLHFQLPSDGPMTVFVGVGLKSADPMLQGGWPQHAFRFWDNGDGEGVLKLAEMQDNSFNARGQIQRYIDRIFFMVRQFKGIG